MKRILLTGGGTAGHITPNLALIPKLQALDFEIQYIGRESGIEKDLIAQTKIPYYSISAGKLRRYFDIKNLTDIFKISRGFAKSLYLVRKLRPDLIFSKGGFVSCPVVWAGWINRVPIIIHESDITPGLANKLSMPFSTKICFSFPETESNLPQGKATYTGIPVRDSLLTGNRQKGRKICGWQDSKPVILIIGGSQGSEIINNTLRNALNQLLEKFLVAHICGQGQIDLKLNSVQGYKQFAFVDNNLPHLFAMADLVVSRAGATTLFELLELKKANLLIPLSLKASRGDQILNARSFKKRGYSQVLSEEDLNANTLTDSIYQAYINRKSMVQTMNEADAVNGVEKVMEVIKSLASTQ